MKNCLTPLPLTGHNLMNTNSCLLTDGVVLIQNAKMKKILKRMIKLENRQKIVQKE